MSSFWQQRLAPQQPAPQQPAEAPSNRPWWQPAPVPQQAQQPAPQPQQQPFQQAQPSSVTPAEGTSLSEALTQTEYTSTKAQSAKDTEACPNCGSQNYMRASGSPNSMKQCFDCGQNPRFEQMAAGTTGIPTKGPVRAARVQNVATGFPKMGTVIDHI